MLRAFGFGFTALGIFVVAACGAKENPITGSGGAANGGATGSGGTSQDAGEIRDGSAVDAKPDSNMIVPNPVIDAGPTCVDGGRKPVTKIDLLFMIDNSSSMADKQVILAQAVPDLVSRLIDPVCIDPMTLQQVGTRRPDGTCAIGVPDFDPVKDIHIGIITSSLGNHGARGICEEPDPSKLLAHNDDKAHLVARTNMDMPVPTFQNEGFLNWNPMGGGASMPSDVVVPFQTMVTGVGQHGCGYEASLEAIYRFLIDPDPYQTINVDASMVMPFGVAVPTGTDTILLKQRADFLRPDSLVAVMALTDENDCSIMDSGQAFYSILQPSNNMSVLPHGTTPCLKNPEDPCCHNCFQLPPGGCPPPAADPECQAGSWTQAQDPPNLRCWQQKKRYGVDFLYPVQRYIDGFTKGQVPNRAGTLVDNPLYSDLKCNGVDCAPPRDRDLVFLAGVVGVPWQDIAIDPNDLTKGYMTPTQLGDLHVWQKIVGDPHNASGPVPPTDPHMIESIAPRPGLADPGSAATADPIHGHEWDISQGYPSPNADLQYACTFELDTPKVCTEVADCDCFVPAGGNAAAPKNPLCQNRTTGAYGNTQTGAKAYPGIRHLEVLRGLGQQAIVGSICPANSRDKTRGDYGYRPVISAIVNRIRNPLRGVCVSLN